MYKLPDYLWPPQARGIRETMDLLAQDKSVCLYGPTGSGKTTMATELFKWIASMGGTGAFYLNRKLLIPQTAARFRQAGLHFGIRAADYEDCYDYYAPFQICSADTERARVFKKQVWPFRPAWLTIVDEAHIQKSRIMAEILKRMRDEGGKVVLLTATPIGLSRWVDELVVSGTMQEYRECKAIVPAKCFSLKQPDMSKVERNLTGEFVMDGEKKRIYTQTIVDDVLVSWRKHNPDARPSLLYAPDVAGSVWFADQFQRQGVNWAHVDATDCVVDGLRARLTRPMWAEILERFKANDIKGISSKFKLREGLDVPEAYFACLATPIGSLASYLQTIGRILRYSAATPDSVIVCDHGGNYLRHDSPNAQRPWRAWWDLPEHVVSKWHDSRIREKKEKEPIRCPKCGMERRGGIQCLNPACKFIHAKSMREVIMADGTIELKEGNLINPKYYSLRSDTEKKWTDLYFSWKRSKKCKGKSFNQLAGWFAHKNHYHPPRNLPWMPIVDSDWARPIGDVAANQLQGAA